MTSLAKRAAKSYAFCQRRRRKMSGDDNPILPEASYALVKATTAMGTVYDQSRGKEAKSDSFNLGMPYGINLIGNSRLAGGVF
ncbi:MAG: hypothetical protein ACI9OU_000808 [Candidatus Promineifilaceae bacterium]|jgi:hypothetical protein